MKALLNFPISSSFTIFNFSLRARPALDQSSLDALFLQTLFSTITSSSNHLMIMMDHDAMMAVLHLLHLQDSPSIISFVAGTDWTDWGLLFYRVRASHF